MLTCRDCLHYPMCYFVGGAVKEEPCINFVRDDVIEVVRCEDCVFWQDNNGGYPHEECRWCKDETPDAYDYCSYGMRKDGADNE